MKIVGARLGRHDDETAAAPFVLCFKAALDNPELLHHMLMRAGVIVSIVGTAAGAVASINIDAGALVGNSVHAEAG